MAKWSFAIFLFCVVVLLGIHLGIGQNQEEKNSPKSHIRTSLIEKVRREGEKLEVKNILGIYKLDKEKMIEQAEKALASLPKKDRPRGQLAIDQMKMLGLMMVLNEGGEAEFVVSRYREGGRPPINFKKKGSWKIEGSILKVSSFDPRYRRKETSYCFFQQARLICLSRNKNLRLIFKQQ